MEHLTLEDDIRAVLGHIRQGRETDEEAGAIRMRPGERHELELEDLRLVADRHFQRGRNRGHEEGMAMGRDQGLAVGSHRQRDADLEVMGVTLASISARLERLQKALSAQEGAKGGKDKRTKSELREEAVEGLDALRAGIAVVGLKMSQVGF